MHRIWKCTGIILSKKYCLFWHGCGSKIQWDFVKMCTPIDKTALDLLSLYSDEQKNKISISNGENDYYLIWLCLKRHQSFSKFNRSINMIYTFLRNLEFYWADFTFGKMPNCKTQKMQEFEQVQEIKLAFLAFASMRLQELIQGNILTTWNIHGQF